MTKDWIAHLIKMQNKQNNIKYNITFYYNNGDHDYIDENGMYHLIRDGKEIASGIYVYSYENGDYEYEDEDEKGIRHLVRDGKVIASGIFVYSYANLDYRYTDENGIRHLIKNGGTKIKTIKRK